MTIGEIKQKKRQSQSRDSFSINLEGNNTVREERKSRMSDGLRRESKEGNQNQRDTDSRDKEQPKSRKESFVSEINIPQDDIQIPEKKNKNNDKKRKASSSLKAKKRNKKNQ